MLCLLYILRILNMLSMFIRVLGLRYTPYTVMQQQPHSPAAAMVGEGNASAR